MQWCACTLALVVGAGSVRADPDPETETETPSEDAEHERDSWLTLDPIFLPARVGLGAVEGHQRTTIRLDPHTTITGEGSWWQNEDGAMPAVDVPGVGYRGALQLDRDFGFITLTFGAAYANFRGPTGFGRYYDVGIALRHSVRLSRWTTLWISLGIATRTWVGKERPDGEVDSGAVMLNLGGTFK